MASLNRLGLPEALDDAAAAALVEWLHALADAAENHYAAQLLRYYDNASRHDDLTQRGFWDEDEPDPPF